VRIGVIQSSFIPWRGYFDFIASVDKFIFYDDVQYSKGSWRNRNRIKCPGGARWLTVPVRHRSLSQLVQETEIDDRHDWRSRHMALWSTAYRNAPFYSDVRNLLGDLGRGDRTISQINTRLIRSICAYLEIDTPLSLSSEFAVAGQRTERLMQLLQAVGATSYLSGPSADSYLDKESFRHAGIRLEYKSYDYAAYPQQWDPFDPVVSVLDLIANCGPRSMTWVRSQSPDQVIVS
jgi:hypothetical protein